MTGLKPYVTDSQIILLLRPRMDARSKKTSKNPSLMPYAALCRSRSRKSPLSSSVARRIRTYCFLMIRCSAVAGTPSR
jgi:hypothetical protein